MVPGKLIIFGDAVDVTAVDTPDFFFVGAREAPAKLVSVDAVDAPAAVVCPIKVVVVIDMDTPTGPELGPELGPLLGLNHASSPSALSSTCEAGGTVLSSIQPAFDEVDVIATVEEVVGASTDVRATEENVLGLVVGGNVDVLRPGTATVVSTAEAAAVVTVVVGIIFPGGNVSTVTMAASLVPTGARYTTTLGGFRIRSSLSRPALRTIS